MKAESFPNAGGIHGLGNAKVDTQSEEFLALQQAIQSHFQQSQQK